MVIIKNTTSSGSSWYVYHRSLGFGFSSGLLLNSSGVGEIPAISAASATTFTPFTNSTAWNETGYNYIAYVFAHDPAADGIIQCGSFSSTGFVDLGWEPQWIIMKSTTNSSSFTGDWRIFDYKRGIVVNGDDAQLFANDNRAENTGSFGTALHFNSTGFTVEGQGNYGTSTVYMAIRR
jgi:hypothetical protein